MYTYTDKPNRFGQGVQIYVANHSQTDEKACYAALRGQMRAFAHIHKAGGLGYYAGIIQSSKTLITQHKDFNATQQHSLGKNIGIVSGGMLCLVKYGQLPPALPAITESLSLSLLEVGWLVSIFSLLSAAWGWPWGFWHQDRLQAGSCIRLMLATFAGLLGSDPCSASRFESAGR